MNLKEIFLGFKSQIKINVENAGKSRRQKISLVFIKIKDECLFASSYQLAPGCARKTIMNLLKKKKKKRGMQNFW